MILGIPIVLITAIIIYMAVTFIAAELLKRIIYFVDPANKTHSVLLCWGVGFGVYLLVVLFYTREFSFVSFLFVLISTGLLTVGYKIAPLFHRFRGFFR